MCLYTALSYPISQVLQTVDERGSRAGFPEIRVGPYNDIYPAWDMLPDEEYRKIIASQSQAPFQFEGQRQNTDQLVFDPRVWNSDSRALLERLFACVRPKVVLISSVSPAHPYAIEISSMIKQMAPETIIILGGRHADETIRVKGGSVSHGPGSIIAAMAEGKVPNVVDFVISGEGYYALDFLMKCISVAMDIETKSVTKEQIVSAVSQNLDDLKIAKGSAAITYLADGLTSESVMTGGGATDLADLPFPYDAFAIRARFPVFKDSNGRSKLTAHVNTAHSCPFRCIYCSESASVVGRMTTSSDPKFFERLLRSYTKYGAEAFFFDDPVLCGGNLARINSLLEAMLEMRRAGISIKWGAQLTVNHLVRIYGQDASRELLPRLRSAGCSYLYIGIESLAEEVMSGIDKRRKAGLSDWLAQVRLALGLARDAGIMVGSSVLFGLPGETRQTMQKTIDETAALIEDGLLLVASPNIVTYHPATRLTLADGVQADVGTAFTQTTAPPVFPPYSFFEEAFPGVIPARLTEEDIWFIHNETFTKWGAARNMQRAEARIPGRSPALPAPSIPRGEFYSGAGLSLVDERNYPEGIKDFLSSELELAKTLLLDGRYDALIEVGCMDIGFFLDEAVHARKRYVGIDIVPGLVEGLNSRIKRMHGSQAAEAHVEDVLNLPEFVKRFPGGASRIVACFPFNSFGNIPARPEQTIDAARKAGVGIAVFTYGTDLRANEARSWYYKNSGYKNIIMNETRDGVLFSSDDGLWSYAYHPEVVSRLMVDAGYDYERIEFGGIGVLHVGRLR
ncbi:MAG: radical SAM protein [Candidatus Micrarchaeota archaeon]